MIGELPPIFFLIRRTDLCMERPMVSLGINCSMEHFLLGPVGRQLHMSRSDKGEI